WARMTESLILTSNDSVGQPMQRRLDILRCLECELRILHCLPIHQHTFVDETDAKLDWSFVVLVRCSECEAICERDCVAFVIVSEILRSLQLDVPSLVSLVIRGNANRAHR